jgi:hypothetical protein
MIGSRALRRFEQKHADFERAAEVCCHAVTSSALTDAIVCARAPGPAGTGSVALRDWGWRLGNHWAAQVDANALSAYLIHCKLYLLVRKSPPPRHVGGFFIFAWVWSSSCGPHSFACGRQRPANAALSKVVEMWWEIADCAPNAVERGAAAD